jgi:8-oxo-dGTP pyrophosphatase MutT (NUDIX family)
MIKRFDQYSADLGDRPKRNTAGVAVLWEDKILLVHPTGASWSQNCLGIPKGRIEPGEDPIEAAVRELREETGIEIDASELEPDPQIVNIYREKLIEKQLIYFNLRISNPGQIGMDSHNISKYNLQLNEIDWAGFVSIERAYQLIHPPQLIILDRSR